MQNNHDYPFKPRGIEKWHAFAALISGEEQKKEATDISIIENNLLDDKLEELDNTLNEALIYNHILIIKYITNNEVKTIESVIVDIDEINKNLILENSLTILLKDILDLQAKE